MLGLKSITLNGEQISKAVDEWLKRRLQWHAHDFRVSAVQQPHTYRDQFQVTFEPLAPEKPEIEISDT